MAAPPHRAMVAAALAALALGAGCGAEEGAGAAVTGLDCEPQAILEESCQGCHAAEPRHGAPMPLVTLDDLLAPAVTDPSRRVWEVVARRVRDADDPMPPSGLMAPARVSALDGYFAAGLPRQETACAPGSGGGVPEVGPEHLPCDVTDTFRAFGGGPGGGYHLAADAGNRIQCFVFDSPWGEGAQGVGFAPVIDDERVLHHWILWGSETYDGPTGASFDCTGGMPRDSRFITGWAPGGANDLMPEDVGMRLPGPGAKLLLQVHYWNVAGHADVDDRSGVAVCAGGGRPHTAAIHTLGSLAIAIPPRAEGWSTSGDCTPDLAEPAHVLASGPHMHTLGTAIRTEIFRGGLGGAREPLVDVQHWDFHSQGSYPTPTIVAPGDVLRTTCTYSNPTDGTVYFGDRTEDEMCFNFVLAYPPGSLVDAAGRERGICIAPVP